MTTLRLATYNIHSGVGDDGVYDLDRTATVIDHLDADVVGLQEVDVGPRAQGASQSQQLARSLGYLSVEGPLTEGRTGSYGNALLSRLPVRDVRRIDLGVPGREPRGALEVTIGARVAVHVITTHLGLLYHERRRQVARLLEEARAFGAGPVVLMGDLNEWLPGNAVVATLDRAFGRTAHRRTFPTQLPILPLDRIWVRPRSLLRHLEVHRTPLTRLASDHYPVVAEIDLESGPQPAASGRQAR